jgi:hypothetical protein
MSGWKGTSTTSHPSPTTTNTPTDNLAGSSGAQSEAKPSFSYKFDPITATAADVRALLDAGALTCVDLVDTYLYQISRYNHYLRGVLQTAPRDLLLKRAKELDAERKAKKGTCGPLHGIPVSIAHLHPITTPIQSSSLAKLTTPRSS